MSKPVQMLEPLKTAGKPSSKRLIHLAVTINGGPSKDAALRAYEEMRRRRG